MPISPFRVLVPYAEKAKAAGKKVYHLNIGQPDIPTPQAGIERMKNIHRTTLEYSPAQGIASLRNKLVGYYESYQIDVAPEEIIITSGASEGLYFLMLASLEPGDEIIVPEPFYANYTGFAYMAQVNIRPIPSSIETGFALPDIQAFEEAITPRTKAILLTNPSNPTGAFYSEAILKQLELLLVKHDLFLFVDEVYREFCYGQTTYFSALNLTKARENVVVIDSFSKRYSACGIRVGAMLTYNEAIRNALIRLAKLRLSPPLLGQLAAEAILDTPADYIENVRAEYQRRRDTVYERLSAMPGVLTYLPGGAFYCFARFPVQDAMAFCQWLLESYDYEGQTLMLAPGNAFYSTPGKGLNEVRIAYVLNCEDLNRAMDCLENALVAYQQKELAEVVG